MRHLAFFMHNMNTNPNFVKVHQPCPDCGSSDALAVNKDGSTKCFSCGKFTPKNQESSFKPMTRTPIPPQKETFDNGIYAPLSDRSISKILH